jgi:transcription elongation factor Elf1
MGCYEALFFDGRNQHTTKMLRSTLKSFLVCVHCDEPLKINKKNALALYMSENIVCSHCGLNNDFPLYWLLAKAKINIVGGSE